MKNGQLRVSAPGRICLFGEHQDYFELPVIAGAINLRIFISGKKTQDNTFKIDLPDIGEKEKFSTEKELSYEKERDYLKSVVNVLRRQSVFFLNGWSCVLRGTIPINSGTSSSSALVVAWIRFLLEAAGDERRLNPEAIAELAFQAEVAEFKEPGGKMDHYSSSLGGVVAIHFGEKLRVKQLNSHLQEFVLADSLVRKNTTGTLGYIKGHVLNGVAAVRKKIPGFNLKAALGEPEKNEIERLEPAAKRLLKGTLMTRDLTAQGESLFEAEEFDPLRFGSLLLRQQEVIRDYLQLSLPQIDRMIETSLAAGALGAKINGSGQGGCIFAYAPGKSEEVAEALRRLEAKTYVICIDEGARRED